MTNSAGLLVAKVEAGASLDFEPQAAGAEAPTQAAGCLLEKAGKFLMAEQTTSIVLELRGTGLDQELGNRVQITGREIKSAGGSAQAIEVVSIKRIARGAARRSRRDWVRQPVLLQREQLPGRLARVLLPRSRRGHGGRCGNSRTYRRRHGSGHRWFRCCCHRRRTRGSR